jgi:Peptidogalycan biosysnthesis/recognition
VTPQPVDVFTRLAEIDAIDDSAWDRLPVHPARTRRHLLDLEHDRRFATTYHVVRRQGRVQVILPVYAPLTSPAPDAFYDVAAVASAAPVDPRAWALIGGRSLASSAPLAGVDAATADIVRVVCHAADVAREQNRRCAALYVDSSEPTFLSALASAGLVQRTEIATRWDLRAHEGWDAYLASLPSRKRRYSVRRDVADLAALGLEARTEPYATLVPEAAPLVAETSARHGTDDDPDLAEMRLDLFGSDPALPSVAWAVRESSGKLLGASFAWCLDGSPGTVAVHSVGVADDIAARGLVYRELMFMAPLRLAWAQGLGMIALGLGSDASKRLRGAVGTSMLAVLDDD